VRAWLAVGVLVATSASVAAAPCVEEDAWRSAAAELREDGGRRDICAGARCVAAGEKLAGEVRSVRDKMRYASFRPVPALTDNGAVVTFEDAAWDVVMDRKISFTPPASLAQRQVSVDSVRPIGNRLAVAWRVCGRGDARDDASAVVAWTRDKSCPGWRIRMSIADAGGADVAGTHDEFLAVHRAGADRFVATTNPARTGGMDAFWVISAGRATERLNALPARCTQRK
jgi:hypothetical protein